MVNLQTFMTMCRSSLSTFMTNKTSSDMKRHKSILL